MVLEMLLFVRCRLPSERNGCWALVRFVTPCRPGDSCFQGGTDLRTIAGDSNEKQNGMDRALRTA
jgi:hypothetical protein